MQVNLLYLFPTDNREVFLPFAKRWVESYRTFPPGVDHQLHVCYCGPMEDEDVRLFPPHIKHQYLGQGQDIGSAQFCSSRIEGFLVTGTARHFYWKPNHLARMVKARERFGDGIFFGAVSLEACPLGDYPFPNPHGRTAYYGIDCERFQKYPYQITNRERAYLFESGEWGITRWMRDSGLPTINVCFSGMWEYENWTKSRDGFRQGNQSNLLFRDKHTELFAKADHRTQAEWRKRAWGV